MKSYLSLSLLSLLFLACTPSKHDQSASEAPELLGSMSAEQRDLVCRVQHALEMLPDEPHGRTRNRELGLLAETVLKQGEGSLGIKVIDAVDNWRNTQLKAALAVLYFKQGRKEEAHRYISEVERTAEMIMGIKNGDIVVAGREKDRILAKYDDFRLDRIKVAISRYCWAVDDREAAKNWSKDVLAAEQSDFIKLQAESSAETDYAASLAVNMILAEGETFEGKIAAIDGFVQLYELYYADEEKRADLEGYVDQFSVSMPVMFRVKWMHKMAVAAHNHGDAQTAERHYHEASLFIAEGAFRPRIFFPLKASNLVTAYKLDFPEEALEGADLLYEEYKSIKDSVFSIHRAEVLCAIAEAFTVMEKTDRAAAVYVDALEQAGINPNSRPRAEDLNLIVLSLIENDVPLSPVLLENIDGLISSLGEPW